MGAKEEREVDVESGKFLELGLLTGEAGMAISQLQPLGSILGRRDNDWLGEAGPRNGRLDMPLIDEGIAPETRNKTMTDCVLFIQN